jgi:ankyrin repeat protein
MKKTDALICALILGITTGFFAFSGCVRIPGDRAADTVLTQTSADSDLYGAADILEHDIAPRMKDVEYDDFFYYDLYEKEISECEAAYASYSVHALAYDADDDGRDEIISYFTSTLHSGSLGNVFLDVFKYDTNDYRNCGLVDQVFLNQHPDVDKIYVDILKTKTNGFYDFGVSYVGAENIRQKIYRFDGERYRDEAKEGETLLGKNNANPLFRAMEAHDFAWMQEAAEAGADPNEIPPSAPWSETNPILKTWEDHLDFRIVECLLEAGADANFRDRNGYPLFVRVAGAGHYAELLLRYGADVNAQDGNGRTALDWHIRDANDTFIDSDFITLLLENGAAVSRRTWELLLENGGYRACATTQMLLPATDPSTAAEFFNPLECAAALGDSVACRKLMAEDVPAEAFSMRAAVYAAAFCEADILEAVLAGNPEVISAAGNGPNLFRTAIRYGNVAVMDYLSENRPATVEAGLSGALLDIAVENNRYDAAAYLLEHRDTFVFREYVDPDGYRAVGRAGNAELLRLLDSHGYKTDESAAHEMTVAAMRHGHLELLRYLTEQNLAPLNQTLHRACMEGNLDFVKFLVDSGAEPDADQLEAAARRGYLEIVKYLLGNGVDVNQGRKSDGRTALASAARFGYLDTVKYLVQSGAKPEPATISALTGSFRVLKFLTENGVNVTHMDETKESL